MKMWCSDRAYPDVLASFTPVINIKCLCLTLTHSKQQPNEIVQTAYSFFFQKNKQSLEIANVFNVNFNY